MAKKKISEYQFTVQIPNDMEAPVAGTYTLKRSSGETEVKNLQGPRATVQAFIDDFARKVRERLKYSDDEIY